MIVGVPGETHPGERRVALVPGDIPALQKLGLEVLIESGAGARAGFPDAQYSERGARLAASRAELFAAADVLLQVRAAGAAPAQAEGDVGLLRAGQLVLGFVEPLGQPRAVATLAATGASAMALELVPRISRAQSMDALSSMATVAGYKAVLLAAATLPRMFPMLMTAAGTVTPARVFVIGAGVAGLQACATAKRLGARVEAYDVRAAVKEQVESVGASFVELPLETGDSEDKGGYAKAQGEEFYRRQRQLMGEVVARNDVVITTAVVPGRPSPVLVTAEMVAAMQPGSVIVDLAAERGGNCELTEPGRTITTDNGVTIVGAVNLAGDIAINASSLYAKNLLAFLELMIDKKEKALKIDWDDDIIKGTLVAKDGRIVHPSLAEKPA